jgi:hypothetical protein
MVTKTDAKAIQRNGVTTNPRLSSMGSRLVAMEYNMTTTETEFTNTVQLSGATCRVAPVLIHLSYNDEASCGRVGEI